MTYHPDNIDYNSLKHFIKVHTNRDEAKAIAIPGQPDTHLAKVEDELYHELCAQHDRAGLFVTAKADEINRRLRTRDAPPHRVPPPLFHLARCTDRCVMLRSFRSCIHERLTDVVLLAESLSDEIQRLILRCANANPESIPRKRQRKFVRLEREVLQCGDDIQYLQRFVNAQAIAFRKILKKYRVRAPFACQRWRSWEQ